MRYRGEIDGLRAVAVLPVILYHAGFGGFSGGFVGVDVFFVISGYLITTIIADDLAKGRFSITRFYERRSRRILPALFLVSIATIPFGWWLMDPFEFKELGQSITSTVTFSSNIYFFLKTGYFDVASDLKPLLHTWSLAVEEQFYIFFPLLLIALWRLSGLVIVLILALLLLISFVLALDGVVRHPSATFFMLHTRAWELLIGSLVALYLRKIDGPLAAGPVAQGLGLLGLTLIVLPTGLYDSDTPFPGLYAVPPVLGTALIILMANPGTLMHRLLNLRLLIAVGLVSYSAYLWHQPIFAFSRIYTLEELTTELAIIGIVLTFVLAMLTKWLVEDPFRHRLFKGQRTMVLSGAFVASMALAVFGGFVHYANGLPDRSPMNLTLAQNYGLSETCSGAALDDPRCRSSEVAEIVLWGDSLAMHIGRALSEAEGGIVQATLSNCPPLVGYSNAPRRGVISCEEFNDSIIAALEEQRLGPVTRVVMAATFSMLRQPEARAQLRDTLVRLRELGLEPVLVSPTPTTGNILKCIKLASRRGAGLDDCAWPMDEARNTDVFSILARLAAEEEVVFVDLRELICPNSRCEVQLDGTIVYRDNMHLANGADDLVTAFLEDMLSK